MRVADSALGEAPRVVSIWRPRCRGSIRQAEIRLSYFETKSAPGCGRHTAGPGLARRVLEAHARPSSSRSAGVSSSPAGLCLHVGENI